MAAKPLGSGTAETCHSVWTPGIELKPGREVLASSKIRRVSWIVWLVALSLREYTSSQPAVTAPPLIAGSENEIGFKYLADTGSGPFPRPTPTPVPQYAEATKDP